MKCPECHSENLDSARFVRVVELSFFLLGESLFLRL